MDFLALRSALSAAADMWASVTGLESTMSRVPVLYFIPVEVWVSMVFSGPRQAPKRGVLTSFHTIVDDIHEVDPVLLILSRHARVSFVGDVVEGLGVIRSNELDETRK